MVFKRSQKSYTVLVETGRNPESERASVQIKATYKVQTLQPETVRCTPLTAVHIVSKGENNLKGNT